MLDIQYSNYVFVMLIDHNEWLIEWMNERANGWMDEPNRRVAHNAVIACDHTSVCLFSV